MIENLSIFIIAKNEADRIGRTIEAAKNLSEDIIVIDSGSTDETVKISKDFGAKVFFNEWPGFGLQKQFAEDQCQNDWLLNLDADEVISDELANSIKEFFIDPSPKPCGLTIKIIDAFPTEKTPPDWSHSVSPVRLYHKLAGRYNPSPVHDRVDMNNGYDTFSLKGNLNHYSIRDFGSQLRKLDFYSEELANDLINRGKKMPVLRLFTEFPLSFLKVYFLRRYCFRGLSGFSYAIMFAFYRFSRIAKFIEKSQAKK